MTPELHLALDGQALDGMGPIAPPEEIAPRQWLLGVAAVQITVEEGRPRARLRAHRTGGGAARVHPLPSGALVQIALGERPRSWPAIPRSSIRDPAVLARIELFLDGERRGEAALAPTDAAGSPAPRAFGHVYCRWLRGGAFEPGFDLTGFHAPPLGEMYPRLVHDPLPVGAVVSYRVTFASGDTRFGGP